MRRVATTRRALVTGGGTGIGRGLALALARRGYRVAVAGRRAEVLDAVVAEVEHAVALPVDLAQPPAAIELAERAQQALAGPLDVLINNAGVMLPGRLENLEPLALQQALHVNLTAPLLLTQAALPQLKTTRGSVAFIVSQAALLPVPFAALYSATKAGLQNFGAALRYELEAEGVHVLLAYPPATATAMTDALTTPTWARRWAADPLRIGEEIVAALEHRQSERHWFDYQTPLIWLYKFWPALVRRLFRAQRARFEMMMKAGDAKDSEFSKNSEFWEDPASLE